MSRTAIITTARAGSTRLPGKTLLPFGRSTLLGVHVSRLLRSGLPVIVATTVEDADDAVATEASQAGGQVFRGSEHDVLGRVHAAAHLHGVDTIVLTWGDSPFIDAYIVHLALDRYTTDDVDLVTTKLQVPQGLDCEVFSTSLLDEAAAAATGDEREHVTLYFQRRPGTYRIARTIVPPALQSPEFVLTVDEQTDYDAARAILARCGGDEQVPASHVVDVLRREPSLTRRRDVVA